MDVEKLMRGTVVFWIWLLMIHVERCHGDKTIRIAAYDSDPIEYIPEKMMARRMGQGPRVIQDVIRPPRQAESLPPRRRRPIPSRISQRQRLRSSVPMSEALGTQDSDPQNTPLGPPLVLLDPDSLKNPDSDMSFPVGPPKLSSTVRSASIIGVVRPPGISPPSAPDEAASIFGFGGSPSISGAPRPPGSAGIGGSPGMPSINGMFGPPSMPMPPAPPGAPSPPISMGVGPPSTPLPGLTPAPPSESDESQVTNIKCLQFGTTETYEAVLSLPKMYEAVPVFEDRPMIDPTTNQNCRMIPTQLIGMFQLIVSNYEACGVRKCRQSNGETWNCLILRFPRLNGLKLPEDEIIEIRCRPHDRTADDIHVLAVATAKYADKSGIVNGKPPTVFEGLQEFECEIGLFRQLPGTEEFNTRVKETPLDLGENVQLWSIIKEGDGWEYSRLSEVVIQKQDGVRERSAQNTAVLVFSDGCRNPNYKVIAPNHPFRDKDNKLVNKFTFRAFLFQDMEPGDSLLISAKVIGCILEEDCRPATCSDDGQLGYGKRRKKRSPRADIKEFVYSTTITNPSREGNNSNEKRLSNQQIIGSHFRRNVTDWSRDMAIKIRMPDGGVQQKLLSFKDCDLYLVICVGIMIFFCILSIGVSLFITLRKKRTKFEDPTLSITFPPSTESKRKLPLKRTTLNQKEPLRLTLSSSGSTTESDLSSIAAPEFQHFPVPPTVRKRKSQVNAELLGLFGNETGLMPFAGPHPYPPMLNYYGYMVMPHPAASSSNHQKKSVRAVKRTDRERATPEVFRDKKFDSADDTCSCRSLKVEDDIREDHRSVIHITSSDFESQPKKSQSKRPKPKPRKKDPIYCEIQQNTQPTLV